MEPGGNEPEAAMVPEFRDHPAYDETAQANRKILTDALDALLEGREDAFWAIFDPEVTFHEASCLPYGGAHVGLEATKKAYAFLCEHFSKMRSVMEAVLASRDVVMIYQTITFEAADTGKSGTLPVAELFRLRDGKVIEWRAHYFDACMVAEALRG
ncbi:MAG: nuclear transport factor 2 family protein [Novosphingobium sp.]|nr:nuclear transport factor 2 family protein [Novosphingobium sp.]